MDPRPAPRRAARGDRRTVAGRARRGANSERPAQRRIRADRRPAAVSERKTTGRNRSAVSRPRSRRCRRRPARRCDPRAKPARGRGRRDVAAAQALHRLGQQAACPPVTALADLETVVVERQRDLGVAHPDTLTAMLDLAEALWAEGHLGRARKLEEAVVAGRRALYGEAHYDTLKALGKLAATFGQQGDLAQARKLQEEVAAGMRALYGGEHRETLRAVNNLAGTIAAIGD